MNHFFYFLLCMVICLSGLFGSESGTTSIIDWNSSVSHSSTLPQTNPIFHLLSSSSTMSLYAEFARLEKIRTDLESDENRPCGVGDGIAKGVFECLVIDAQTLSPLPDVSLIALDENTFSYFHNNSIKKTTDVHGKCICDFWFCCAFTIGRKNKILSSSSFGNSISFKKSGFKEKIVSISQHGPKMIILLEPLVTIPSSATSAVVLR